MVVSRMAAGAAGHRMLPHPADVIVEAWAPKRIECLEELVRGVVETFADTAGAVATREVACRLDADTPDDLVVELVSEVILLLDAEGLVVIDLSLDEDDDRIEGLFEVAPTDSIVTIGAAPKGVSRSDLQFGFDGSAWRCRVLVDV